jgi:hypothetical protein
MAFLTILKGVRPCRGFHWRGFLTACSCRIGAARPSLKLSSNGAISGGQTARCIAELDALVQLSVFNGIANSHDPALALED